MLPPLAFEPTDNVVSDQRSTSALQQTAYNLKQESVYSSIYLYVELLVRQICWATIRTKDFLNAAMKG